MAATLGFSPGWLWRVLRDFAFVPPTGWQRCISQSGAGEGVDLSTAGRCATGVWVEDNGGVYWYPTADDRGVRGDPPDPQQMQTGRAKKGSSTPSLVEGTAHGPGCQ
jgi:hypothetical protein